MVGIGAFVAANATRNFGVHFPFTLLVGLAAGAGMAMLIGVVALRVRGLYLAVATLIFAYVCDQYLFSQPWLVQSQSGTSIPAEVIGTKGSLPFFDLADAHIFYFIALAVGTAAVYALANLRDSRIGRAFSAIRGSEVAAASLGINVGMFKLLGFACAGALAGLGGALTLAARQTVSPSEFNFTHSLYFLSIAVVGGLRSIGGAIASALLFAVLVGEVFVRYPAVSDYLDLVSAGMLIFVLLFFSGGLGAVPGRIEVLRARLRLRIALLRTRLRGKRAPAAKQARVAPAPLVRVFNSLSDIINQISKWTRKIGPLRPRGRDRNTVERVDVISLVDRISRPQADILQLDAMTDPANGRGARQILMHAAGEDGIAGQPGQDGRRLPVLLSAEHVTVRFGGLTAVDDASLKVVAGEIIGLIGPNGAGKTTLFNSVLGLNQPASGRVFLFDREVTAWPVHERAALGVGRTFQILQLFGDLTVFENLLVATHLQTRSGLAGSILATATAFRAEAGAKARVRAVLRLMDLEHLADRKVAGLPFGVLRLVEVARTLVTGARLVCFDEPASGLDSTETEGLIEWFQLLRRIGITLLVIEHDVDMVVRLCDYIYVLDQGKLLSEGTPAQIQRDPAVVASYLGTVAEAS